MLRGVALCVLISSCAVDVEVGRECPRGLAACWPQPEASVTMPVVAAPPVVPAPPALGAAIVRGGAPVGDSITLACGEACVAVTALGFGGVPPYRFMWNDGAAIAERMLCPTSAMQYFVRVQDASLSGVDTAPGGPMEATAAVSVSRAECPSVPVMVPETTAPPAVQMPSAADASAECSVLASRPPEREWISRGWCSQAGSTVLLIFQQSVKRGEKMEVRATGAGPFADRQMLQFWGSGAGCDLEEKFAEFALSQSQVDVRVAFTPEYDHRYLILTATTQNAQGNTATPDIEYSVCP